jgi:geranylgeranyl reductase family protein
LIRLLSVDRIVVRYDLQAMDYDAIVVGAGPAGSTLARLLARSGARVLLLDRAPFPRDKPCGGGVTLRAASCLDMDLSPVTEQTIFDVRVTYRLGRAFRLHYSQPLAYMTQRCRLDAFLAEQAAAAGAQFHDGEAVRAVEVNDQRVTARTDKAAYTARVLAAADGVNGTVGRNVGAGSSGSGGDLAVALEGNVPFPQRLPQRWQGTLALNLGGLPGGYGWVFPKGDHLNVGVGGWRWFAPDLREHLAALCRRYGFPPDALRDVRGHHLAMRRPGSPIVRGAVVCVGDAAGLVDPLSGEGIHTAFQSAGLAAQAIEAYLAERVLDLSPYQAAVDELIMPELIASRKLQDIFHYSPGPYTFVLQHSRRFWCLMCRIIRGEVTYTAFLEKLGPLRLLLDVWDIVARKSRYPNLP